MPFSRLSSKVISSPACIHFYVMGGPGNRTHNPGNGASAMLNQLSYRGPHYESSYMLTFKISK